jgi:hypothetical protein
MTGNGQSPGLSDDVLDSLLLDKSALQFIGLRTAYFKPQGRDGHTITGCENNPPNTVKRNMGHNDGIISNNIMAAWFDTPSYLPPNPHTQGLGWVMRKVSNP